MKNTVGESLSFSTNHVSELINRKLGVTWMLLDVDSSSLKRTPPHLSVEGKESETRVPCEAPITLLEKVGEVVADGDLVAVLPKKVCCSCGVQGGKCHREVTFCGELIGWSSPDCRPNEGV